MAWSRNTPWRQGSVLAQKDFLSVGLTSWIDLSLAIAISHDCDIANDNLDIEPSVEFIFACILEQNGGNNTYGKNPRTLHLDYKQNGQTVWIEMLASKRVTIAKNKLEGIQPDETYELNHSQQILQSWLAARYRRHALPNSLVERLRPVFGYIEKLGKRNSSGILSFRLDYEPKDELPHDEPYEFWLSIVYIDEYRTIAEDIANSLKIEFAKLLQKTKDSGMVDLRKCEAVSEMEFTLRDMRDTVEFHLEHLSYRSEPPGPIL